VVAVARGRRESASNLRRREAVAADSAGGWTADKWSTAWYRRVGGKMSDESAEAVKSALGSSGERAWSGSEGTRTGGRQTSSPLAARVRPQTSQRIVQRQGGCMSNFSPI
jgi:hypothetical protein